MTGRIYKKNDFIETIKHAMKRELREESSKNNLSKDVSEIGETKLLGFFRWVNKGGKPEFVGITKCSLDLSELIPNKDEVNRPRKRISWPVDDKNKFLKVLKLIKSDKITSTPLYMCALFLETYIREKEKESLGFLITK